MINKIVNIFAFGNFTNNFLKDDREITTLLTGHTSNWSINSINIIRIVLKMSKHLLFKVDKGFKRYNMNHQPQLCNVNRVCYCIHGKAVIYTNNLSGNVCPFTQLPKLIHTGWLTIYIGRGLKPIVFQNSFCWSL